MQKTTYHTSLKDAIRLRVCPEQILRKIPRANIHRWLNEKPSKYFGRDENELEKYIDLLRLIQHHPGKFFAYGRIIATLNQLHLQSKDFQSILRTNRKKVISVITKSCESISLRRALKIFGISRNTFYNWKSNCVNSSIGICKRIHHHQLTRKEVEKMERLISDPRLAHWGISSIHHLAQRKHKLFTSLNTWYKYNKIFGWRNLKKRVRKANYQPLRASRPNQYWHADVSIHQCLDGSKAYIYAVMDNASRKVLSWEVTERLSGVLMKNVLQRAMNKTKKNLPKLITDGGTENLNKTIETYLNEMNVTHLQAGVDIRQSNSMIEALFKQLKHQFLLKRNIYNLTQLKKHVDFFFEDANANKPLAVLNGLTPDEAYVGQSSSAIKIDRSVTRKAQEERSLENRANLCISCFSTI